MSAPTVNGVLTQLGKAVPPVPGQASFDDAETVQPAGPYEAGVPHYEGWNGVIPIQRGAKVPAIKGITGRDGAQLDWETSAEESQTPPWAACNLALRLDKGLIGIDVDAYDQKRGGETLATLEAELGPLPAAPMSTSRTDGISGIRLYRVPVGEEYQGVAGPEIEVVQFHHRFVMAWPSIHPKTGATYRWDGCEGPVPRPDEIPELPAAWVEHLRKPQHTKAEAAPPSGEPVRAEHLDSYTRRAVEAECEAIERAPHGGQNNQINESAFKVGTLVGAGALTEAEARLLLLTAAERGNHPEDRAQTSVQSGLTAGMAKPRTPWPPVSRTEDLSFPEGEAYMEAQAVEGGVEAPQGEEEPLHSGHISEAFWKARALFGDIRNAAHSRGCSGDVALFGVLARLAAMLPPGVAVDSGIRSPASLNIGVALMGASGTGKSAGNEQAELLLPTASWLGPEDFLGALPLGSGEGIAEMYLGNVQEPTGETHRQGDRKGEPKTQLVRKQVRHQGLIYSDEGEALLKMLQRTGSTLGATLRTALTGGTIGQRNGREETTRLVLKGRYSFALVIGFQPELAGPLMDDWAAGTPQRFIYAWTTDPTLPRKPPAWPGELRHAVEAALGTGGMDMRPPGPVNPFGDQFVDPAGVNTVKKPMTVCESAREELYEHNYGKAVGEVQDAPLDAHWPVMRLKLAGLLALLDGRYDVNEEDWALSKLLWEASCGVRDAVVRAGQERAKAEAQAKEDRHVKQAIRTDQDVKSAESERVDRLARKLAEDVHQTGPEGIRQGAFSRDLKSSMRPLFPDAVAFAEEADWIVVENTGRSPLLRPGTARPA